MTGRSIKLAGFRELMLHWCEWWPSSFFFSFVEVFSTMFMSRVPSAHPHEPSHPNARRWSSFELEARSARSCGLCLWICRRRWRPSLVDCAPPW